MFSGSHYVTTWSKNFIEQLSSRIVPSSTSSACVEAGCSYSPVNHDIPSLFLQHPQHRHPAQLFFLLVLQMPHRNFVPVRSHHRRPINRKSSSQFNLSTHSSSATFLTLSRTQTTTASSPGPLLSRGAITYLFFLRQDHSSHRRASCSPPYGDDRPSRDLIR